MLDMYSLSSRFLANGKSFRSLAFAYRVGVQTIAKIVEEVCVAVWNQLSGAHMKMPQTEEEWRIIAANFEAKSNFPHWWGQSMGNMSSSSHHLTTDHYTSIIRVPFQSC